jgi:hypothetical protein
MQDRRAQGPSESRTPPTWPVWSQILRITGPSDVTEGLCRRTRTCSVGRMRALQIDAVHVLLDWSRLKADCERTTWMDLSLYLRPEVILIYTLNMSSANMPN